MYLVNEMSDRVDSLEASIQELVSSTGQQQNNKHYSPRDQSQGKDKSSDTN